MKAINDPMPVIISPFIEVPFKKAPCPRIAVNNYNIFKMSIKAPETVNQNPKCTEIDQWHYLVQYRIVNNTNYRNLVDSKPNRHAYKGKPTHTKKRY